MHLRLKKPSGILANTGLKNTPLLTQPLNKAFNQEKVWVSMSLCYSSAKNRKENSDIIARAFLATALWRKLADVNVVLQIYNDTNIIADDLEQLNLIKKRKVYLIFAFKKTPSNCLCDCALQSEIGRTLLHQQPAMAKFLQDDDIVITATVNGFLSKPHLVNVLQSKHSAWMYIFEALFYGASPWPTNFVSMTISKWRLITLNATACPELRATGSFISTKYSPPSKQETNNIRILELEEEIK